MKNKTELKPCPFCGGKARLRKEGHREYAPTYSIICTKCFAGTSSMTAERVVIDTWNRRDNNG